MNIRTSFTCSPRILTLAAVLLTMTGAVNAQSTLTIAQTTFATGQVQTFNATLTVDTSNGAAVIVPATANIAFSAGSRVTLRPGFHAQPGSRFRASVDTDQDGIPDAWETAHGLNPNNPADALTTDSAGHFYFLVYQLGLTPGQSWPGDSGSAQLNVHKPQ